MGHRYVPLISGVFCMHLEIIAFLAGLISSTAAIPQIHHMLKTKKTGAVSTFMFCMKNVSNSLWVVFGFAAGVYSVVFWNLISFGLCTTVIVMKHKIVKQKEAEKLAKANAASLPQIHDRKAIQSIHADAIASKRPALRLVYSKA